MDKKNLQKRPPVVSVMGHIDHGKSTLLSYIRKNKKPLNEAGGITQHISAYEIEHKGQDGEINKITFIDTPGHEAFVDLRKRGAKVSDIAILIVSAEDGVKTQTKEALKAILDSNTPYIVAITKIDKPGANIEKTKISLVENGIYIEGMGGTISCIPVSSKTGEGIDALLEMIILLRDLENFEGDKNLSGEGIVLEINQDSKKGIVATCIIKNGYIKTGQYIKAGNAFGKIRIIEDSNGTKTDYAEFSSPVNIMGLENMPEIGSVFKVFDDKETALKFNLDVKNCEEQDQIQSENILPVVVKADTGGVLEAVLYEIKKLNNEKISLKIIQSAIGSIGEADIKKSDGTNKALVIGFNVKIENQAKILAERNGIEVETFNIIYKLSEWLKNKMEERMPKSKIEEVFGTIKVLKTFSRIKDRQIIGGMVESGEIKVGNQFKILRRDQEIGFGKIKNLQTGKVDTNTVSEGKEFGSMIESKIEIMPNDKIQTIN